jgi:transcriptional regulator with XRE-family HTH domain
VVPRFGAVLAAARNKRGLTMGQVVARVHQTGPHFEGFTRAQLSRYEAGFIQIPDPAVLWRLAQIYRVTLQEFVDSLVDDRERLARAKTESPPGRKTARG